jgi:hypothetical protein
VTVTTFAPTTRVNFSFQATFDGALYNVTVTWNISRQDWYANVYDSTGTLMLAVPLVGSPPPPEPGVDLIAGYFTTSTMFYYPVSGTFVVAP